jgi:hypothetical protein
MGDHIKTSAKQREFLNGLYVNKPHFKAPDFVIGNGSVDIDKFISEYGHLQGEGKKLYFDVQRTKDGDKYICYKSTYVPKDNRDGTGAANASQKLAYKEAESDDLPF